MKKPATENIFQTDDANKVGVQRNSKEQSRPHYWCLFYKKYPASHPLQLWAPDTKYWVLPPTVTSCLSPAVPLAQAGVKAGWPNQPGKDTLEDGSEEQHHASPSSLHKNIF